MPKPIASSLAVTPMLTQPALVLMRFQKLSQTALGLLIAYTGSTRPLNSCHSPSSTSTVTIRPMMMVSPALESGETFVLGTIPGPTRLGSETVGPTSVAVITLALPTCPAGRGGVSPAARLG